MPKICQTGKPTINIYTSTWDWSDTVLNIKSKWNIGLDCFHPVILSPFRIFIICIIYKCYGNISKKTAMSFAFKTSKQMFLHTCLIPWIFPIIAFLIVPSRSEFISGFPYILVTTTLTCEEIRELSSQLSLWFILKLSPVVVSWIFKQTSHLDLPHFSEPTFLSKG